MLVCVFACMCVCDRVYLCVGCKPVDTQKRIAENEVKRVSSSQQKQQPNSQPNQRTCSLVSYRHLPSAHRHRTGAFWKFRFVLKRKVLSVAIACNYCSILSDNKIQCAYNVVSVTENLWIQWIYIILQSVCFLNGDKLPSFWHVTTRINFAL